MIKLRKRVRKNRIQLYLDCYYDGSRKIEGLNLYLTKDRVNNKEILKLAEGIRAKRELEMMNSENGFLPTFKKNMNFVSYFQAQAYKDGKLKSKTYHSAFVHLNEFTKGRIKFVSINEIWLKSFQEYVLKQVSINSTLKYFDIYRAVLNCAVRDQVIMNNPFRFFKSDLKKTESKKVFLTFSELKQLAKTSCVNTEVKRAFLFACYTGLRLSDVMNLEWNNIDGENLDFRQKKTSNFEYLPLSNTAKLLLRSDSNVLSLNDGKIFNLPTNQVVNYHIENWRIKAGIEKHISFHTSRHTFATLTLSSGNDLYTVSKLLGHTDIKHTQIYAKVVNESKLRAVNSLPELKVI